MLLNYPRFDAVITVLYFSFVKSRWPLFSRSCSTAEIRSVCLIVNTGGNSIVDSIMQTFRFLPSLSCGVRAEYMIETVPQLEQLVASVGHCSRRSIHAHVDTVVTQG